MHKIFLSLLLLSAFHGKAQNSALKVSGRIDVEGRGNDSIEIYWQKSNEKIILQQNGFFSTVLKSDPDTLRIFYNHLLNTSVPVKGTTKFPLLIELLNIKKLDEVILNTGYQPIPKERATGSFTSLSKKILDQQVSTTVLSRLESITNGLYVDRITGGSGGGKLVIRGLSTIRGPRAPLIVLDNFPYAGNLDNINPNDVESITILKDAAAASIWGAQAGNGVIVITTKRGKFNQKITGSINSNVTLTTTPDLYKVKTLGSADYVEFEKSLFSQGGYDDVIDNYSYQALSPVVNILAQERNGAISQADADAAIARISNHDVRNDFNKYVYRPGINFQQSVSLEGGSNKMAWDMAVGYDNNSGVTKDKYNRITIRTNQQFKITEALRVTTGIDYTQSETVSGMDGYGAIHSPIGNIPIYSSLADGSGKPLAIPYQYNTSYTDTLSGGRLLDWGYYPLSEPIQSTTKQKLQAIILNTGIDYTLIKGVSLQLKYQYGKQYSSFSQLHDVSSYFSRDFVNSFTGIDPGGNLVYNIPQGGILDNSIQTLETNNLRGQINIDQRIGNGQVYGIAGAEVRESSGTYTSGRAYGYDNNTLQTGGVDYTTAFPNLLTGNSDYIVDGTGFLNSVNRFVSFFTNVAYTYRNRYTISASGRRDASNLFGAATNDKWTPLWSIGGAWNIEKEDFFKSRWASRLKLRASYGVSGNADPSRSSVTTLTYTGTSPYTQSPTARIDQFKNTGLSWETVYTGNLGIDYESKAGRIQFSVDLYNKKAINLFGTVPVDYTGLANSQVQKNVASIRGKGWDIAVNTINIKKEITWSTQLNLNFNHDKVISNYLTSNQGSNYVTGGTTVSAVPGKPVYALYAYRFGGLDSLTGDPLGYYQGAISTNYGTLTGFRTTLEDLVYIGPALPTATVSIGNTFRYKRAAITLRITGKFGGYFLRSSINYYTMYNGGAANPDYLLRWQKPGDEKTTFIPSAIYPASSRRDNFFSQSEPLFSKAGSIRIQYITASYEFIKPSLQAYVNFNNVGLIWVKNKYGIDPEYNNTLRPSLNIAAGIKLNF